MDRTWSTDLVNHVDEQVTVAGWVHNTRLLARVAFLIVRDARGMTQVVINDADVRAQVESLLPETVVRVVGRAVASAQAPLGVEIHDPEVEVLTAPVDQTPVDLRIPFGKEQLATILDHAPVALRHPRRRAAFAISAASVAGYRRALDDLGFVEVHTPKLVASATETGANVFKVKYFEQVAFLAQSPQFFKQMLVGVFERVYEIGPVFRAEPHDTVRHLAEYTSLDAELGFIDDHRDVMRVLTAAVRGMVDSVRETAAEPVALLEVKLPVVPDEIPHIHFRDAQEMLEPILGEKIVGEPDLAPAHERALGEWAKQEFGSDFLFVVGYPMVKRPFYTHPDLERPEFSNSFDLLFRGLELVTGGQRLHRYDDYVKALTVMDQALDPYQSYLEAFAYGMPPHGGFAIGLERWVARLLGVANIRETTLFPRDRNRLQP